MGKTGKRSRGVRKLACNQPIFSAVVESLEPRRLLSGVSFAAVRSFPLPISGSSSNFLVDNFSGDGSPVVAALDSSTKTLSVVFSNSDGSFTPVSTVSNVAYFITAGDVNGDGSPDIISGGPDIKSNAEATYALSGYYSIDALINDRAGGFSRQQVLVGNNEPTSAAVADFIDGNSDADIVLTSTNEANGHEQVSLLLNNGDGGFTEHTLFNSTNTFTYSTAVGDFNGHEGIAITNNGSPTVTVLLGNGDSSFATNTFTASFDPTSIMAADVNGDGRQDLVLGDASTGHILVMVAQSSGNVDFSVANNETFSAGFTDGIIQTANLAGNSRADLVVNDGSQIEVFLANSGGTFNASGNQTFSTANSFASLVIGDVDLDGDGYPDIVVTGQEIPVSNAPTGSTTNYYYGSASVYLNNPNASGTFDTTSNQTFFDGGDGSAQSFLADVNGDGNLDLLTTSDGRLSVTLGNGNGSFISQRISYANSWAASMVVGDFTGDGQPDLALLGDDDGFGVSYRNTVSVLLANVNGTLSPPETFYAGYAPETLVTADFSGDGLPDLADVNRNSIQLLLANASNANATGSLGFNGSLSYSDSGVINGANDPPSMAIGYFNGDSTPDLVAIHESDDVPNGLSLITFNSVSNTFSPTTLLTSGIEPYRVAVGDFTGDGKEDIAVIDANSHRVFVFLGNGDGTFKAPIESATLGAENLPNNILAGNFEGGAQDSIAVAFPGSTGPMEILRVNNISGTYSISTTKLVGVYSYCMAAGVLNGDGDADLVIGDGNSVSILLSNGDDTFQAPQEVGSFNFVVTSVAVADFSGDGMPDIAAAGYCKNSPYGSEASIIINTTDKWTGAANDDKWASAGNWSLGNAPKAVTTPAIIHLTSTIA